MDGRVFITFLIQKKVIYYQIDFKISSEWIALLATIIKYMASQLESGLCGIKHEQNKIVNSFLLNDWTAELAIISSIVYEMNVRNMYCVS